jgi:hypothetical protein
MLTNEDRISYLLNVYFGDYLKDPTLSAVERAYLDLARTQHGFSRDIEKQHIQEQRKSFLVAKIRDIGENQIESQDNFDEYHKDVMLDLKRMSQASFTFGQAQKWVNMSLKYCLIIKPEVFAKNMAFYHVPIDNIVLAELPDYGFSGKWSKLNNYDDYIYFQNWFRKKYSEQAPILTELKLWYKK